MKNKYGCRVYLGMFTKFQDVWEEDIDLYHELFLTTHQYTVLPAIFPCPILIFLYPLYSMPKSFLDEEDEVNVLKERAPTAYAGSAVSSLVKPSLRPQCRSVGRNPVLKI